MNYRGCSDCEAHPEAGTDQCRECLLEDAYDALKDVVKAHIMAVMRGGDEVTSFVAMCTAVGIATYPVAQAPSVDQEKKT